MTRWFVYDNVRYYPSAEIVEAPTPEAAARIVCGDRSPGLDEGWAVFPMDALAGVNPGRWGDLLERLEQDGRDH